MSEVQISFRVEPGDPLWGLPVGTVVDFSDFTRGRQLQLRGPMRLHRSEYFEGSGRLVLQNWRTLTGTEGEGEARPSSSMPPLKQPG